MNKEKLYVVLKGEELEVKDNWFNNQGVWVLNSLITFSLMFVLVQIAINNGGVFNLVRKIIIP